ncbi:MAG TPA: flagellar hook-length control protein FliK [Fimbriimonadaceae bacterium]|nr:flagellar hook-length control protein FliK [Fimbriimonadaceae bacterium]HRJ32074.1 flagellar hook-length control protein FliK [Fimbriimonadaceae bacterium]
MQIPFILSSADRSVQPANPTSPQADDQFSQELEGAEQKWLADHSSPPREPSPPDPEAVGPPGKSPAKPATEEDLPIEPNAPESELDLEVATPSVVSQAAAAAWTVALVPGLNPDFSALPGGVQLNPSESAFRIRAATPPQLPSTPQISVPATAVVLGSEPEPLGIPAPGGEGLNLTPVPAREESTAPGPPMRVVVASDPGLSLRPPVLSEIQAQFLKPEVLVTAVPLSALVGPTPGNQKIQSFLTPGIPPEASMDSSPLIGLNSTSPSPLNAQFGMVSRFVIPQSSVEPMPDGVSLGTPPAPAVSATPATAAGAPGPLNPPLSATEPKLAPDSAGIQESNPSSGRLASSMGVATGAVSAAKSGVDPTSFAPIAPAGMLDDQKETAPKDFINEEGSLESAPLRFALDSKSVSGSSEPVKPPPALPMNETMDRIADQMALLAARRPGGTVQILLNPEELGSILISVKNLGQKFDAEIVTTHDHVRASLEAGRNQLVQAVEAKGLSLGQFSLSSQSDASSLGQSSPQSHHSHPESGPRAQTSSPSHPMNSRSNFPVDAHTAPVGWLRSTTSVDLRA